MSALKVEGVSDGGRGDEADGRREERTRTPLVVRGSSRGTWEPNSPGWPALASALRDADIVKIALVLDDFEICC